MKSTCILLLLILAVSFCNAQDTIRSLIISEARIDWDELAYIEITNMGDDPVQLNQFELGKSIPGVGEEFTTYQPFPGRYFMLPDRILQPGESFLICTANDYGPEQFALGEEGFPYPYPERANKSDLLEEADLVIHLAESDPIAESDSVSENWQTFTKLFGGQAGFYIEQHLPDGDSTLIDVVAIPYTGRWSVAGVPEAALFTILVRRFIVKQGNLDFANAAGIGEDDSEWMVIPIQGGVWRKTLWTAGNHMDAKIDENTLESDNAIVDFPDRTITVPWGTLRGDDIINYFTKKPGIAWNYHCSPVFEDSLSQSAKTGDQLEVFGCGNNLQRDTFNIIVSEPPADANQLLPVDNQDPEGEWRKHRQDGILEWPRITRHNTGLDTIWGYRGGIPFDTRTDSLLERLEKAPKATWEFVWIDGVERPDLKNGDILKVTAKNGDVRNYYIAVKDYKPSNNAYLRSITWPDFPELYREMYEMIGDSIPFFSQGVFYYQLKIPYDINGIPSLLAKTDDMNATVGIERAISLTGTKEMRTVKFTVTAEDDSTKKVYTVELIKEKAPDNIQPYSTEPFLSEVIFQDMWSNGWVEICNPGNQPLDLSNYMFTFVWGSSVNGIEWNSGQYDWPYRYMKYIPGYKWVNEDKWAVDAGRAILDLNVNPIVKGGDVFVAGQVTGIQYTGPHWWATDVSDILFDQWNSPWGESDEYYQWSSAAHHWIGANWYLYKILNDSIKQGLKAANDPNDFELIETFGNEDNSSWNIGGIVPDQLSSIVRKPQFFIPKKGYGESFGTVSDSCEWTVTGLKERQQTMTGSLHYFGTTINLGFNILDEITYYKSTVRSLIYKVSEGYSQTENIRGITQGTNADDFLSNIIKADSGQSLKLKSFANGTVLKSDDLLHLNDTLIVLSADSLNTTKYILEVTEEGLNSDALLSSNKYSVVLESEPKSNENYGKASIHGVEYGTSIRTVLDNLIVPAGASLTVIDKHDAYIPLIHLNYNNQYVPVTVNPDIYVEVVAEDGITMIKHQLIPEAIDNDAFLISDVYSISQKNLLIDYVPRGINVTTFLNQLIPSFGAELKVVNKFGQDRNIGKLADDDKVVVLLNNSVMKVYYVSMLAEKYIPETTYLAFLVSEVYHVDQLDCIISDVTSGTSVSDFMDRITPAFGAKVVIVSADGIEKTIGNITATDSVKVTSLDGKTTINYLFDFIVSSETLKDYNIEFYPNPTDEKVHIKGIMPGSIISIYNSTGTKIKEIKPDNSIETVSLAGKPAGIYLFQISCEQKFIGNFKIIKRL